MGAAWATYRRRNAKKVDIMTAQVSETLLINGRPLMMCACPLDSFLATNSQRWSFAFTSTANWRGYEGTWELMNNRLYLKALEGELSTGEPAKLETLFPGFPDGVFAHWFSGTIRCPQGKMLDYVHGGFSSKYERDLFMEFKRGVLVAERTVVNGVAEANAPEGCEVAAFTVFPRENKDHE